MLLENEALIYTDFLLLGQSVTENLTMTHGVFAVVSLIALSSHYRKLCFAPIDFYPNEPQINKETNNYLFILYTNVFSLKKDIFNFLSTYIQLFSGPASNLTDVL